MFIVTTPPKEHIHMSPSETTGPVDNRTLVFFGTQQEAIAGTQGIGVKTPKAAAVAAATVGFARDIHIPKVGIFTSGTKSALLATGCPPTTTRLTGRTDKGTGAAPKEHLQRAPQTAIIFGSESVSAADLEGV